MFSINLFLKIEMKITLKIEMICTNKEMLIKSRDQLNFACTKVYMFV
jgi:hypothetical protein